MLRALLYAALTVGGCATAETPARRGPVETPEPTPRTPTPPEPVAADTPVRIGLGRTAVIDGVPVEFARIVENSRCPQDVECVWAGRAIVRLVVGGTVADSLWVPFGPTPNEGEPNATTQRGLRVEVRALHPYPGSAEARAGAPNEIEVVGRRAG